MATVRRARRVSRVASTPRRKRIWARDHVEVTAQQGTAPFTIDLCNDFCAEYGTNSLPPGSTVGPVIIAAQITLAAAPTTNHPMFVGGVITQNTQQAADVADPLVDLHVDWMGVWPLMFTNLLSARFDLERALRTNSMRKMEELGTNLFFTIKGSTAVDTMYDATFQSSILIRLS